MDMFLRKPKNFNPLQKYHKGVHVLLIWARIKCSGTWTHLWHGFRKLEWCCCGKSEKNVGDWNLIWMGLNCGACRICWRGWHWTQPWKWGSVWTWAVWHRRCRTSPLRRATKKRVPAPSTDSWTRSGGLSGSCKWDRRKSWSKLWQHWTTSLTMSSEGEELSFRRARAWRKWMRYLKPPTISLPMIYLVSDLVYVCTCVRLLSSRWSCQAMLIRNLPSHLDRSLTLSRWLLSPDHRIHPSTTMHLPRQNYTDINTLCQFVSTYIIIFNPLWNNSWIIATKPIHKQIYNVCKYCRFLWSQQR